MDMGKSVNVQPQQSTAKQKPCAYFLGYTVHNSTVIVYTLYDSSWSEDVSSVNFIVL